MQAQQLHTSISNSAFRQIQRMFQEESGIMLSPSKQALVASRLRKRLAHHDLPGFDAYCEFLCHPEGLDERRMVIDLLTTNETYFFREPDHFTHLGSTVLPSLTSRPLRVWCAASSSGEEPYSLAMTLADRSGTDNWQVVATDLCRQVLHHARQGVYEMQRLQYMPSEYLKRFCLKGTGDYDGTLRITRALRDRAEFLEHNLVGSPGTLGKFDVIFMRNVLIYFDNGMKQNIVANALEALRPGGWLYIGHSESLHGLDLPLTIVKPSIYRKAAS